MSAADPSNVPDAASARSAVTDTSELVEARRAKLSAWRSQGIEPYGKRVEGLVGLAEARARFDAEVQAAYDEAVAAAKASSSSESVDDPRARGRVAGRVMQHRDLGKLVFLSLRDHTGDLQATISKALVPADAFELAKRLDYGDIVVCEGPIGATRRGEVCVWADRIELACKSLFPPPEKWHGLVDPEHRSRRRYLDLHVNPDSMRTFTARSRTISRIRRFMEDRGFLEVETPMMQPIAGGAAARPFTTHHNALDLELFMRVAPELYLKRLLVGGMPKVFEINRNFRNEGVDRSHNPEFTALEAYEAFGDSGTMMELTESLVHRLAVASAEDRRGEDRVRTGDEDGPILPFGDLDIDYRRPFDRITYEELFERGAGFSCREIDRVRARAREIGIDEAKLDDWFVVNEVFEHDAEPCIDPARPTFVVDWPSAISPLTRAHADRPEIADRWDIFIGGMEVGPAYTELNDPDVQLERFEAQLRDGGDDEERTFRSLDRDFIDALRVGMPPAGGLGLGIDRLVMLLTDRASIRDVILFPLLRPASEAGVE
ncbi:MAG: lysine--tRNA ligase [Phycisphaerales bacterium]